MTVPSKQLEDATYDTLFYQLIRVFANKHNPYHLNSPLFNNTAIWEL
jgi:hypothetical protein